MRKARPSPPLLRAVAQRVRDGFSSLTTRLGQQLYTMPPGKGHTWTTATTGAEAWFNVSDAPLGNFSLLVFGVGGAPTDWDVVLEGSLDGVHAETLLQHSLFGGAADGETVFSGSSKAVNYLRLNVVGLTPGPATGLTMVLLGMPPT